MSRRGDHRASARMAGLQRLATIVRREELARAYQETDERAAEEERSLDRQREAERVLDAVFARERLCLDHLAWAGQHLEASETELTASRAALDTAQQDEVAALGGYAEAEQRLQWIASRARAEQRKHHDKREELALDEIALLRDARRPA